MTRLATSFRERAARTTAVGLLALLGTCASACTSDGAAPAPEDAGADAGGSGFGGSAGAGGVPYDAGSPCSERTAGTCDPARDCGCNAGLRCTQVVESVSPWVAHTACAAAGTKAEGAACAVDAQSGVDDCVSGSVCLANGCSRVCHVGAPDGCAASQVCRPVAGYFADRAGIGVCHALCDVFAQDCTAGEGCFYDTQARAGICATIENDPATGSIGGQGAPCAAANSCELGTACLFLDPTSPTGNRCAAYCNPTSADACASAGSALVCQSLDALYPNSSMPKTIGVCVPSNG